jgi:hypothetical protein
LRQSDTERITPFRDFLVDHGYSTEKRQVYTLNIQQEMEKVSEYKFCYFS